METKDGAGALSPAKVAEKLRLAEALRANLRRRKAARKRSDETRESADPDEHSRG